MIIKNCASLNSIGANVFNCKSVTQSYNTWNTGFTCSSSDFTSLDYSQMLNDRKSDGSLPEITLLHLTPTSGLIDKGTNVGFSYYGTAPDLGAFEYNPNLTAIPTVKAADISVFYSAVNQQIIIQGSLAYVEVYKVTGESIYTKRTFATSLYIPVHNVLKVVFIVRVISQNGETSTNKILVD